MKKKKPELVERSITFGPRNAITMVFRSSKRYVRGIVKSYVMESNDGKKWTRLKR